MQQVTASPERRERRQLIAKYGKRQFKKILRGIRAEAKAVEFSPSAVVPEPVQAEPTPILPDDENRIVLVIRENPGASIKLIAHWMPELSETQIERRLKKLREAGHIRYDKSAKGWFVA